MRFSTQRLRWMRDYRLASRWRRLWLARMRFVLVSVSVAALTACISTPPGADRSAAPTLALYEPRATDSSLAAPTLVIPTLVMPTPLAKKAPAPADWPQHWLLKTPCAAPCWEGITPGKTFAVDAVALLNKNPIITDLKLSQRTVSQADDIVGWNWRVNDDASGGSLIYPIKPKPQIVSEITVILPTKIRLRDIVAAYGEPSHIVPIAKTFQDPHGPQSAIIYDLVIVYLSHGFYVFLKETTPTKPSLSLDMVMHERVTFFGPTTKQGLDQALLQEIWDSTDLIPWQGFRDFDTYCQISQTLSHHVCDGGN